MWLRFGFELQKVNTFNANVPIIFQPLEGALGQIYVSGKVAKLLDHAELGTLHSYKVCL